MADALPGDVGAGGPARSILQTPGPRVGWKRPVARALLLHHGMLGILGYLLLGALLFAALYLLINVLERV